MYEENLKKLGITLPVSTVPVAMYVRVRRIGKHLLYVSGQLPSSGGTIAYTGKVGDERTLEDGQAAARLCAVNVLAAVRTELGSLDKIQSVGRLGVYVACTADFIHQPAVANAASELMIQVFGDAGQHARTALGVASLPMDATCEVDAIFELKD